MPVDEIELYADIQKAVEGGKKVEDTMAEEKVEEKAEEKKDGGGAKDVTLKSMIIAAVWIGALTLLKVFWGLLFKGGAAFGLEMKEIVLSGAVIAGVFSPVYVSIILDKIKEIKVG